jgi:hypothetical protein
MHRSSRLDASSTNSQLSTHDRLPGTHRIEPIHNLILETLLDNVEAALAPDD